MNNDRAGASECEVRANCEQPGSLLDDGHVDKNLTVEYGSALVSYYHV